MGRVLNSEVLYKARQLEIKARKLLQGHSIGEHTVVQKGYGLEFEQLADYQFGHDVRFIDWKSSARMNKLLVREYREERNRSIILALDCSSSMFYGKERSKKEVLVELAALIAIAALWSKDAVGLILFDHRGIRSWPTLNHARHIDTIIKELSAVALSAALESSNNKNFTPYQSSPEMNKTSPLAYALERINSLAYRDTMVFVLSDFLDSGFEKQLKIVSRLNDCIAVRFIDQLERDALGDVLMELIDIETGQRTGWSGGAAASQMVRLHHAQQLKALKMCGADVVDVETSEKAVEQLIRFFKMRAH